MRPPIVRTRDGPKPLVPRGIPLCHRAPMSVNKQCNSPNAHMIMQTSAWNKVFSLVPARRSAGRAGQGAHYLEHDAQPAVPDRSHPKVHPDGRDEAISERVVGHAEQETALPRARIANHQDLAEIILIATGEAATGAARQGFRVPQQRCPQQILLVDAKHLAMVGWLVCAAIARMWGSGEGSKPQLRKILLRCYPGRAAHG